MSRLLITGGAGYLGTELILQARAGGWDVAATCFSSQPDDHGITWLRLDIRDKPAVARAFDAWRPDVIIHTAYRQRGADPYVQRCAVRWHARGQLQRNR